MTMQYTGDETRDGGQTPGPFEEMRRRMAESGLETPGARKRRRKDKKRKWRWTIGNGEDSDTEMTPTTAIESPPITSVWRPKSTDPHAAFSAADQYQQQGQLPCESATEDSEMSEADQYERRGQSLDLLSDSEISEDNRPGTSHSL